VKASSIKVGKRLTYHGYDARGQVRAYDAIVTRVDVIDSEEEGFEVLLDDPEVSPADIDERTVHFAWSELEDHVNDCYVTAARKTNRLTLQEEVAYAAQLYPSHGRTDRMVAEVHAKTVEDLQRVCDAWRAWQTPPEPVITVWEVRTPAGSTTPSSKKQVKL
jgi:hypothetical protein